MILVTGAGGKTGRALVKILAKTGSVCAFVHHEEQAASLKSLGAERVSVGDMRDPLAIRLAMQAVRRVYHICPNMSPDEFAIGELVIAEARAAEVEHFVYHSVLHPQTEKMSHHWQKLHVEGMIFESGLPFTVLQPAPYMQNLLAGWKTVVEDGILRVPYSVSSKFSFVDLEDVAEAAKIVLTEPNHLNASYELAGTLPLSHMEVAEIMRRALNRDVRAEKQETADWKVHAKAVNESMIENLLHMFEYYDEWGLPGNPNVLRWLLNREPTSLEDYLSGIARESDAIH